MAQLASLGPGDRVPVSAPRGPGFPLARAAGRPLWLIGTGSGVAPLKAVVEALLPHRSRYADVHLLYGVRHADELAYTARFGEWAGRGVRVVPVVSQPRPRTWDGPTGRVQDHLPAKIEHPAEAWFFLCGLPEMDREVAAALLQRGVAPDQIFRNY
jgi:NAD(P)H-flavin reductase